MVRTGWNVDDGNVTESADHNKDKSRRRAIACWLIPLGVGVITAVAALVLFLVLRNRPESDDADSPMQEQLLSEIDAERIRANLRLFTREPHLAGSAANERLANIIKDRMIEDGLEDVHFLEYDVLLSRPDWEHPNRLHIFDPAGGDLFATSGVSPVIIEEEQSHKGAGHQWLAYSAPGDVSGDVVYGHYGRPEDFELLKKRGIDVKGKIMLMRFGANFRGDKVEGAAAAGAIGAILFSDPADVAAAGADAVYKSTVWMPPHAVQRGTLLQMTGDPLTPLTPAIEFAYRSKTIKELRDALVIPAIPALPLSYSAAREVISRMAGEEVPREWRGGVNATYRFGPGLLDNLKLRIQVNTSLERRKIRNVIGYIRGAIEPDRYVIAGNHYDAWVYGAQDPNSGSAVLVEVSRALAELKKTRGWRPARSILFAHWDAEEFGIVGSTEFVEQFVVQLQRRAVVDLNLDCITGNFTLDLSTVPALYDVAMAAAKLVPNHVDSEVAAGRKTLFNTWNQQYPGANSEPRFEPPFGGSDHTSFLTYAGVPVMEFHMRNDSSGGRYPLYHTMYETHFLNEQLMDPDHFKTHRAAGQFWGTLVMLLSDPPLLPLNVSRIAQQFSSKYIPGIRRSLVNVTVTDELKEAVEMIDSLAGAVKKLEAATADFAQKLPTSTTEQQDLLRTLRANEKMLTLHQCFVNPRGVARQPEQRNLIFSRSTENSYAGVELAAVHDAIDDYLAASSPAEKAAIGRLLAERINDLFHAVNCAVASLGDFI